MMYYDRALPETVFGQVCSTDFFHRLFALVRSQWGEDVVVHVEFRRNNDDRRWGSVKFYVGRSSLLEVIATAKGKLILSANDRYKGVAPGLFGPHFSSAGLDEIIADVEGYMRAVVGSVSTQFTEGEGRIHGGFVRRYGQGHQAHDPFVAADKEVVVGARGGAFTEELCTRFGKAHRELDSIGVLADGNIAVVELKKEKESVELAAYQAATHVLTFQRLIGDQRQRESDYEFGKIVNKLIEQKETAGLLPEHAFRARPGAVLVPVIAAPNKEPDWAKQWRSGLRQAVQKHNVLLDGLQLWKLSGTGEIEEAVTA